MKPAASSSLTQLSLDARMGIVYFVALSVSLGSAVAALGRLALYLLALFVILANWRAPKLQSRHTGRPWDVRWQILILVCVAFMALSIFWSTREFSAALGSWSRHARWLTIPILWLLLRNAAQANAALQVFVLAQLFVVASSCLLVLQLPVPWASATVSFPKDAYSVFGSYLEQAISELVMAFILLHQRATLLGHGRAKLAVALAVLTMLHVLLFLSARTGYLLFILLCTLAVTYHLPRRWRWSALLLPIALAGALVASVPAINNRFTELANEINRAGTPDVNSSSGLRLLYWQSSLNSMRDKPLLGSGSGSWNQQFRRTTEGRLTEDFYQVDNPHQMFLLWGVESGLIGLGLLCALLWCIYLASRKFAVPVARSLQSVLLALIGAGMTTSTVFGIGMGDYFCVAIGLLLAVGRYSSQSGATQASTTN